MTRRSYASRRLSLESLEERCNPAAIIPMADFVPDPAPVDQGAVGTLTYSWAFSSRPSGSHDNRVDDLQLGTTQQSGTDFNLNAFAGQTLRLRIAATNNQGKLVVGVDEVRLTASISPASPVQDPRNGDLYVGTDDGVYVGGGGHDELVGGAGRYLLVGGAGQDANFDQLGRLLIGTEGGIWRGVAAGELNLLSKPQNQNESRPNTSGGNYSTGYVKVSDD